MADGFRARAGALVTGQAQVALMPDGRRLHLHHGPIDIVAEAFGPAEQRALAYRQAADRFSTVLEELVEELTLLRQPITDAGLPVKGPVARRMVAAVWPHREVFVTPMAAVAGAVADEVLAAMVAGRSLEKAYVNDGGDISLFLTPGQSLRAGVVADQDAPAIDGRVELSHAMPVRGLATSGWRGRSLSLGIADAVSVLARSAAVADAAATLIANAVDIDHPAVRRRPARDLRDDTDLGELPVTVEVGPLPRLAVDRALAKGESRAEAMRRAGLVFAAALFLQGESRLVGPLAAPRALAAAK
jgi:ApbE superfamily uncharacterized protein (UPF0280 family)